MALTDAYGAITDRYSYDEWGNVTHTALAGSVSDNPYQYVGRYGYYTHYQEPNFKLLQLGVRFYDPQMGRFTRWDQIPNLNRYIYAVDNSLAFIDPDGMKPVKPRDPRWPEPDYIEPWFDYGLNDTVYITPNLCMLIVNSNCIMRAGNNAYYYSNQHFPRPYGQNGGAKDAYRHCVWACLVRKTCGKDAYNLGVIGHENSTMPKGHWDPVTSPMDLANDEMGRKIAGRGGRCRDKCWQAYLHDELYILPEKDWPDETGNRVKDVQ